MRDVLRGVDCMKEATQDRAEILGEYILDTGATVRAAAKVFKISKSTVHTAQYRTVCVVGRIKPHK